jgi:tetratricopeptide (TPR) repeat protein
LPFWLLGKNVFFWYTRFTTSMPPIKKEFPCVLLWLALLWLHPPAPAAGQSKAEASALAKEGVRHFRRENYPQALDHFNRALAADSANVRALYYGGITNQLLFSNQAAVDYLLRSYASNPGSTSITTTGWAGLTTSTYNLTGPLRRTAVTWKPSAPATAARTA